MRKYFIYTSCLLLFYCSKKEEIIDGKIFENTTPTNTGITFSNILTESHKLNYFTYSYLYMGGGVAAGDINNDGLIDLYFTGNQVSNKLYLNKGNLQFEDITKKAGIGGDGRWYTGVTMADVNNDGYLDIYCAVSGKFQPRYNQLFINNQNGTFSEKAKEYGLADKGSSIQSTFFDYDKDGDLDVFVANYPPAKFNAPNLFYNHKIKNHKDYEVDHLYRNDGNKFTDVSKEAGVDKYGLSLSATIGDINNDTWPDIYVSNDFSTPDYMYINNGDGTFKEVVKKATSHTAFYGMGVDIADFNNDGNLDFYQPDMDANTNRRQKANMVSMNQELFWSTVKYGFHYQYMQNCLQVNSGVYNDSIPHFSDVSRIAGVSSTDWTWGGLFADFDNDGNKDLFVSNGTRREVSNHDYFSHLKEVTRDELLGLSLNIPSERIDNFIFRNEGNMNYKQANDTWGISFKGFSTGAVYADLDNDGDLEVITNNLDDVASIFNNKSNVINNFTSIQFEGKTKNKFGLGNRVYVKINDTTQLQELTLTRGFQSSIAPKLHFGIGKSEKIDEIKVVWTDGKTQTLKDVKANQNLTLKYSDAKQETNAIKALASTLFNSNKNEVFPEFKHKENYNDDFLTQVLLPHKMSSFGPALAVGDLNNDGLDDYFIGGSTGNTGTLFYQTENGFKEHKMSALEKDKASEDIGAIIFDADNDGDNDLYVVSGGYEFSPTSKKLQDRIYINKGNGDFTKSNTALPEMITSGSKVYTADFDNDGKNDLLVLGRQVPENYPNAATSYLLKNSSEKGKVIFKKFANNISKMLNNLGMATSAIITDFNNDGWQDIIIVGEWMPIKVFKNIQNDFVEVSKEMGLNEDSRGWWWNIKQGDFDNDGDMDYIIGNNGLNYKYKAKENETFDIYFNDFDKNGKNDIVLGYYNEGKQYPVRGRSCSSQQIPSIKEKFPNYESFSIATLDEVYDKTELEKSLHYQIKSFASIYLENKDGKFIMHKLPEEAQVSSINQILINDYDKDGNLDALIAGNLFVSEVETPRNDGGYGQFLKGDGKGGFKSVPASQSGFFVPGDVKDMAEIKVKNEDYIIAVKNNDYTQTIKINK